MEIGWLFCEMGRLVLFPFSISDVGMDDGDDDVGDAEREEEEDDDVGDCDEEGDMRRAFWALMIWEIAVGETPA